MGTHPGQGWWLSIRVLWLMIAGWSPVPWSPDNTRCGPSAECIMRDTRGGGVWTSDSDQLWLPVKVVTCDASCDCHNDSLPAPGDAGPHPRDPHQGGDHQDRAGGDQGGGGGQGQEGGGPGDGGWHGEWHRGSAAAEIQETGALHHGAGRHQEQVRAYIILRRERRLIGVLEFRYSIL